MKKSIGQCLCAAVAAMSFGTLAHAAAFLPGDLVVLRVGTGAAALAAPTTAGFMDEYSPLIPAQVTPVNTVAMPTAASGSNNILTFTGNSGTEGFMGLSPDGKFITVGGYNAAVGATSPPAGGNNRTIAVVGMDGVVDTSTVINDGTGTQGNIRSVISDGTNIWAATSAGGVRFTTLGSTGTSTQLSTAVVNTRVMGIFNSQLYVSTMSGAFRGINTIGTGEPTTSTQATTLLPGFDPSATAPEAAEGFLFANATTLYVADTRTAAPGGIQKWTFNGSTWTLAYELQNGATGMNGLAGFTDGSGNEVLFGTETDNKLVTVTDSLAATTLPAGETFTTLATAATNEAFRSVVLLPAAAAVVPEPTTLSLIAVPMLLSLRRRKQA